MGEMSSADYSANMQRAVYPRIGRQDPRILRPGIADTHEYSDIVVSTSRRAARVGVVNAVERHYGELKDIGQEGFFQRVLRETMGWVDRYGNRFTESHWPHFLAYSNGTPNPFYDRLSECVKYNDIPDEFRRLHHRGGKKHVRDLRAMHDIKAAWFMHRYFFPPNSGEDRSFVTNVKGTAVEHLDLDRHPERLGAIYQKAAYLFADDATEAHMLALLQNLGMGERHLDLAIEHGHGRRRKCVAV